jgi:hypothetical protein
MAPKIAALTNLERFVPFVVAALAVTVVIMLPMVISNFHTLHSDQARAAMSGQAVQSIAKNLDARLNAQAARLTEVAARFDTSSPISYFLLV